jgi:hypothetical protein
MKKLTAIVAAVLLAAAALFTVAFGPSAGAASPTVVSATIGQGSTGTNVGDATLTRTLNGDGTETLTVDLGVPGGDIKEVLVCVSTTPWTSRASGSDCQFIYENLSGTTFHRDISLAKTYVGDTMYVQVHVVNGSDTAFACWHAPSGTKSNSFYGNCEVPTGETPVPVGAIGVVGLTGGLAIVFAGVQLSRRRTRTAAAKASSA